MSQWWKRRRRSQGRATGVREWIRDRMWLSCNLLIRLLWFELLGAESFGPMIVDLSEASSKICGQEMVPISNISVVDLSCEF